MLAIALLALVAAGCGGSDDDDKKESGPLADNKSSMKCLTFSTLSPELYDESDLKDVEPGIARLMTPGAKGAEILGGERSAVVIEYESPSAARAAQDDGRNWPETRDLVKAPNRIRAFDKTVMIDLAGESHVRKVVEACAYKPDQTPPAV
jgi:hypothetical protein